MQVIKKDERKEDFDREKIKSGISRAAQRTDVQEDRVNEVAEKVAAKVEEELKDKEEARSSEISDIVLRELDAEEKGIADEFRSYEKQQATEETEPAETEKESEAAEPAETEQKSESEV